MICGNPTMVDISASTDHIENMVYIDYGFTNFNNLFNALTTIFQVITLEGWSTIMYNLMDTERDWIVCTYFISLVVIGAFFLLNLITAILSDSLVTFESEQLNADNTAKKQVAQSVLRMMTQITKRMKEEE